VVATQGDGGAGAERGLGGEGKPLGLPLIRTSHFLFFPLFSFGFPFIEFYSLRHFEVLSSGLTKILKLALVFLEFFILKNFQIF
jgi:hypothetical protein